MAPSRKQKPSLAGDQLNLWDGAQVSKKEKPIDVGQENDISGNSQKKDQMDSLSRELIDIKKKFSRLQNQLKKEKVRKYETELAYLGKLVAHLPALMLFEVLKAASLKETKEVIKPLKATAGIAISTTRSIRELGATIGLTPAKAETTLRILSNAGFVKKRELGAIDLGQFSRDRKERIFPMWYRDVTNPDHIMLLFSPKSALPEK